MASPFPGMDPYIEGSRWFPGFHDKFIVYLEELLQPSLPASYYALSNQRVWVELSNRQVTPDIGVARATAEDETREPGGASGSAVAVAPPAQPVIVTAPADERHEAYLDVYVQGDDGDKLVTSIELLSLANKRVGENNRDQYLEKQQEMLASRVNLVEIDLLRSGLHTTAVPRELASARCGAFDYHVSIHAFDRPRDYIVYPILLHSPLPKIDIPLLPGDAAVVVDLQKVFTRAYDVGPYRRLIRYLEQAPEPPLLPEQAAWAATWLKQQS